MIKEKLLYFMFAFVMLSFLPAKDAWSAEWQFRGLLPRGIGYYDKSSIRKKDKNIFQVWTVTLYNEKGKADAFSILKKQNKEPQTRDILNQEMVLVEFDCLNEKYRITAMEIYDENGNAIFSATAIDSSWHEIVPHSINEKLKKTVCNAEDK